MQRKKTGEYTHHHHTNGSLQMGIGSWKANVTSIDENFEINYNKRVSRKSPIQRIREPNRVKERERKKNSPSKKASYVGNFLEISR